MLSDFNLEHYAGLNAQPAQTVRPVANELRREQPTRAMDYGINTENDAREVVIKVVERVAERGIDITGGYRQWLSIGFGLAQLMDEEGRYYFHRLSQYSAKYNQRDTDRQYTNCLRHANGSATYRSVLHYAEQNGISIRDITRVLHHGT